MFCGLFADEANTEGKNKASQCRRFAIRNTLKNVVGRFFPLTIQSKNIFFFESIKI
ncbi:hypothetical protein D3C86_2123520 [compost metagenome]